MGWGGSPTCELPCADVPMKPGRSPCRFAAAVTTVITIAISTANPLPFSMPFLQQIPRTVPSRRFSCHHVAVLDLSLPYSKIDMILCGPIVWPSRPPYRPLPPNPALPDIPCLQLGPHRTRWKSTVAPHSSKRARALRLARRTTTTGSICRGAFGLTLELTIASPTRRCSRTCACVRQIHRHRRHPGRFLFRLSLSQSSPSR